MTVIKLLESEMWEDTAKKQQFPESKGFEMDLIRIAYECVSEAEILPPVGPESFGRLLDLLVETEILTEEQRQSVSESGFPCACNELASILAGAPAREQEIAAQLMAKRLRIPFVSFKNKTVGLDVLTMVDVELVVRHSCMPFQATPEQVVLAMANPFDSNAIKAFEVAIGRRIKPVFSTAHEIAAAINRFYSDF